MRDAVYLLDLCFTGTQVQILTQRRQPCSCGRATVEVTVCRRLASQLEIRFLKKVLKRSVTQAVVDELVGKIEEALHDDHAANDRSYALSAEEIKALKEAYPQDSTEGVNRSGHYHLLRKKKILELTSGLVSEEELKMLIEAERERMREGHFTKEELIGLRLYTGPPFMKFNTVLRMSGGNLPSWMTDHLKDNRYVTSIHTCVSGMVKLSKVSRIPAARMVYRGFGGVRLPRCFWVENEVGARGGVEFAFMSTTSKREVAMQYIPGDKAMPTIFEIQVGMIDKGGSVSWISQFPGEDEILMPPRSNIEVTGQPHLANTCKGKVLVIPARINANLKAKTIEEIQAQRRNLHMSLVENVVREVKRDVKELQNSAVYQERKVADPTGQNSGDLVAETVIEECDEVLQLHVSKDADFFNEDHNYNKILGEALKLKANAMSKVHYWIDNKEVWASDHHKRKILDAARLVYGRRVNKFLDAKQSGDVNEIKMLARQLCIEEGFMARDLDEVDDNGETPLHVAAASGNLSAVRLLVDGGADIALGDSEGRYKTYANVC